MVQANKIRTVLFHACVCFLFLVLPILISSRPDGEPFLAITKPFIRDIIANILLLLFVYLNYYSLVPALYFKNRYVLYTTSILLCLLVICFLPSLLTGRTFSGSGPTGPPPSGMHPTAPHNSPPPNFIFGFLFIEVRHHIYLFIIALFFTLLLRVRTRFAELKEDKLNAELSTLKAQINPHFLFNTLNSIYALAVKKDDKTADAIVHLSGLMRYIIKEANDNKIPLQKELDYIANYIELQRSRLGNTVKIDFNCTGNTAGLEIVPLILITYIENAFKYGVNPDEDSEVTVVISILKNGLYLKVQNNIVRHTESHDSTGIGITNTTERLQLLYPQKHQLVITEDDKIYLAELTLELS